MWLNYATQNELELELQVDEFKFEFKQIASFSYPANVMLAKFFEFCRLAFSLQFD